MRNGVALEQRQAWLRERQQAAGPAAAPAVSLVGFAERHYTVGRNFSDVAIKP